MNGAPPAINITATPNNPPIQIPAQGGSFTYFVQLQNNTGKDQTVQVWAHIVKTDRLGERAFVMDVPIGQGQTVEQNLTQNISSQLAPGEYNFVVSTGFYPNAIDTASFQFSKLAP